MERCFTQSTVPVAWFGGKSRVAPLVWERFGDVKNVVDPFFGSGAFLLGRPHWDLSAGCWRDTTIHRTETANDKDGYISNFYRALQHDPEQVAAYADRQVNENDLHAIHTWLRAQKPTFVPRLEADPDWYDAKIAGWWCWGMAVWIGSGFCGDSGAGPWVVQDGQLVNNGDAGQGVARQLVHLNAGQGVAKQHDLYSWFAALAARLRHVRVCCGDWARVCGPTPTIHNGLTGVFLDPPYSGNAGRDNALYAEESLTVAHDVRAWAIANGNHPLMRIALCSYGEEPVPDGWTRVHWKANGGYASQSSKENHNAKRETIDFSPHCLSAAQSTLFTPPQQLILLEEA